MSSTRFVGNAKELKSALNDKADNIVITDRKLALAVRVIKSVTYTKLALIAGGAGVAAASFWNPVGAISGGVAGASGLVAFGAAAGAVGATGISGGAAAVAVAAIATVGVLGLAAMVMHKDYALSIDGGANGKATTTDDKPDVNGKFSFKMTLKRNGSR
ncbi:MULTISPECIES: hypothetical protein [Pseudomonas]|uniref:hypothetical protein n=1 Tax=Pseudomonas TaxID=286 RepID=UPI0006D3B1E5|nr:MULTISPECIES: hypothetical protein [Pseudomonas]MCE4069543.1 hypothetical protein [Pseudomonas nitritireducens]MCE4079294.1 hypothetical protein [Pseudomonas nitroreducens]OBY91839.1 hypothetical protein A6723_016430 [Pseudomonas sp. AU11447]